MIYSETMKSLRKQANISSVGQVIVTFKASYNNEDVSIEILDFGESDNPHSRYQCSVTRLDDGKVIVNNPSDSVEGSLMGLHWYDLD